MVQVVTIDLSSLDSLEGKAEEIVKVVKSPRQLTYLLLPSDVWPAGCAHQLWGGFSQGWCSRNIAGGSQESDGYQLLWYQESIVVKIIVSSGTMELTRHLVPHLKAQGGLVVNISSLQVHHKALQMTVY